MLDQSFSAHNIETIYCLESRKGNIDIHTMPYEYQEIIANSEQLKKIISDLIYKKGKETRDITEIEKKKVELKTLIEQKKNILDEYLENIANQINSSTFKFSLNKWITKDNKEVFTIDVKSHAHLFAIKQLQYNIRQTFKVKQSCRHSILANVKTFLNSNIPVYVIRTDISRFYESIPHDKLMPMIFTNTLLSNKSKAFIKGILKEYEKIKDTNLVSP